MGAYSDIQKRRTIRIFQQKTVPFSLLKKCVNAARLSPSACNTQSLRFVAVNDLKVVAELDKAVYFGGVVKEKGRKEGEEPKAFIAILVDKEKKSKYTSIDVGIAAEAITLVALEAGVACCMMGAIQKERIKGILGIPNGFEVPLVVALGYPAEKPVLEGPTKDLFYWIDLKGELHVPKLSLEEVLHRNRFREGD